MIKINKIPKGKRGCYGLYKKISPTRGLKIFFKYGISVKNLLEDCMSLPDYWVDVLEEATLLKIAQGSNISPKLYSIKIIVYKKKMYPAIEMQHFEGHNLKSNWDNYKVEKNRIIKTQTGDYGFPNRIEKYVDQKLRAQGVTHEDIHPKNLIILKDQTIKVIDFSTELIYFSRSNRRYQHILKSLEKKLKQDLKKTVIKLIHKNEKAAPWWIHLEQITDIIEKYNGISFSQIKKDSIEIDVYNREPRKIKKIRMQVDAQLSKLMKLKVQSSLENHGYTEYMKFKIG